MGDAVQFLPEIWAVLLLSFSIFEEIILLQIYFNYCYLYDKTGKVGGFLASIPEVMVAGLLCVMWAMLTALGLSNLRYSEAGSSRNIIIVGLSLFFSLSIPAYFQQYDISPSSNLSVPSYFQPYIVTSHGPFHTKYEGVCLHVLSLSFCQHFLFNFYGAKFSMPSLLVTLKYSLRS